MRVCVCKCDFWPLVSGVTVQCNSNRHKACMNYAIQGYSPITVWHPVPITQRIEITVTLHYKGVFMTYSLHWTWILHHTLMNVWIVSFSLHIYVKSIMCVVQKHGSEVGKSGLVWRIVLQKLPGNHISLPQQKINSHKSWCCCADSSHCVCLKWGIPFKMGLN